MLIERIMKFFILLHDENNKSYGDKVLMRIFLFS